MAPCLPTAPTAPELTYLFTANISFAVPVSIGLTSLGSRQVIPVSGGSFEGPTLNGTIPAVGSDWGLTDSKGNFSPDALFVLQTSDGAEIFVRAKGHVPYEQVTFETGSDTYSWLNTVVAIATAAQTSTGVSTDVWQVGS